jgi:hypothetical protein
MTLARAVWVAMWWFADPRRQPDETNLHRWLRVNCTFSVCFNLGCAIAHAIVWSPMYVLLHFLLTVLMVWTSWTVLRDAARTHARRAGSP